MSNLENLPRVYGDETWRVYDALDESLQPAGPDSLYDVAGRYLAAGSRMLDAGCRDAQHLVELVRRFDVTGVGVDPVEVHIERARAAVAEAEVGDSVEVMVGVIEELPFPDEHFDFVWCRDVLEQVAALDATLQELRRVSRPDGRLLVFTVFTTDRLSAGEAELLDRHLGNVPANLVEANMEAAFARAGLEVERKDVVGTEWREHLEERGGTVSRSMLRLSRLRRRRDALAERFGVDVVDSVEATLHWEVFQFLGKLLPTTYVLRPNTRARLRS